MTAFSPLRYNLNITPDGGFIESLLEHDLTSIAQQYNKSPAQILLRWGIQRGTAVVPKSSNEDRLRENLDLFNFNLSQDEMDGINDLNRNRRFNDPGDFCESAFNTFFPIYE